MKNVTLYRDDFSEDSIGWEHLLTTFGVEENRADVYELRFDVDESDAEILNNELKPIGR